jgi:hypothetical protein
MRSSTPWSSPPHEGTRRAGEVRVRDRLERRKLPVTQLEDGDGFEDVLEAVLPELDERVVLVEERAGRPREDDLAAMGGSGDASCEVNVFADVPLFCEERCSRVQADPERYRTRCEFVDDRARSPHCPRCRREGDKEGVALGIDLDTAASSTCCTHDPSVLGELPRVGLGAELVQELGRALDIREKERDGAGGQLAHTGMMRLLTVGV